MSRLIYTIFFFQLFGNLLVSFRFSRIELARELQRSKKEREDMDKQNRENLKRNEEIAEKLKKENGSWLR